MLSIRIITPILKKPGLPASSDPANFRPISNLNSEYHLYKILERLFLSRLLSHINSSSNFNSFLSAYWPHHSTETALTLTLDNDFHAADNGSATLLASLDLNAAFDSINHNILINRLNHLLFRSHRLDNRLEISSYLYNRRQSMKIGDSCSPLSDITSGVPQRYFFGPCTHFCSLHLAYLSHCWRSQRPAATVCLRHSALHLHICQDHNTEHMSPRVLSLRPTCVVLQQLACS